MAQYLNHTNGKSGFKFFIGVFYFTNYFISIYRVCFAQLNRVYPDKTTAAPISR